MQYKLHTDLSIMSNTKNVAETILSFFKSFVLSGDFKPGEKIPSEKDLAEKIRVSRTKVREFIRALEILGLAKSIHGDGTYIQAPNIKTLSSFIEFIVALSPPVSENIHEVRAIIEIESVRISAYRATPSDLSQIRQLLAKIKDYKDRSEVDFEADFEFHKKIIESTHNQMLITLYGAIDSLLRRSHKERRESVPDMKEIIVELGKVHENVYKALVARDSELAVKSMREHFYFVNRYLIGS